MAHMCAETIGSIYQTVPHFARHRMIHATDNTPAAKMVRGFAVKIGTTCQTVRLSVNQETTTRGIILAMPMELAFAIKIGLALQTAPNTANLKTI